MIVWIWSKVTKKVDLDKKDHGKTKAYKEDLENKSDDMKDKN